MIYSTSAKYAVVALLHLAASGENSRAVIRGISRSTGISPPFLAKIAQNLVKAGILHSAKGRGGGLELARPAKQINLAEVVRAIDGGQALSGCFFGLHPCGGPKLCPVHPLWDPIRSRIIDFLNETTLADLARQVQRRGGMES